MSEEPAGHRNLTARPRLNEQWVLSLLQALPLGIALGIVSFMVEREGGFALTVWSPIALLMLGITVTIGISAARVLGTGSRASLAAIGLLGAFVVWSFATITWAIVRGDAWDGANRTLLYFVVFAVLASWPTSVRAVWPLVLMAGIVVAIEGVITVEQAIHSSDPGQYMIGSRLSAPLGYPNATAALFLTFSWLMIGLASRSWIPGVARGIAFGIASLTAVLSLLGESRGSVYTLPLVVAAYFLFVPGRLRSLATLAVVVLGTLPVLRPALAVYGSDAPLPETLSHAIHLAIACAVVISLCGFALATADRRLNVSQRHSRAVGVAVIIAAAVCVIVALLTIRPWGRVDSAWHSFKYGGEPAGASHFGGLGSNRYDFWRVALIEFRDHPVVGIGENNFLVPYLELRRSGEEPIYPHSLPLATLSQTGLIGTTLLTGFLACAVLVVKRIPRGGRERELAGVLAAGASVWLLHGLVDWLWEMPVLSVLGMALLGAACSLQPPSAGSRRRLVGHRRGRPLLVAAAATAAIAATISVALPWLAQRDVQRALTLLPNNRPAALATLDRAHGLNPLSNDADLLAGAIADRFHDYDLMRMRFQRAVDRSPDDWYANLELGVAASLSGRPGVASAALNRAVRLNPGEPIARKVLATFTSGRRIDSDAVDRAFAAD